MATIKPPSPTIDYGGRKLPTNLPGSVIYAEPKKTARGYLHKYGVLCSAPLEPWRLELICWYKRHQTGLSPYQHLRRAAEILVPDSLWHPWREDRFKSLCDDDDAYKIGDVTIRNQAWAGPASAGKTNDAAFFAYLYWLAAPDITYVILTSTSRKKIQQRAWSVIQECHLAASSILVEGDSCGHLLNSTMELQAEKGDSKHAIFAQAIEGGEVNKAVQNLLGVHAPRICVIIDEAPGTPEPIYHTISNMLKGAQEVVIISIGNGPQTRLDCFSRVCTPLAGWDSITVDSSKWKTAARPEFQLPPGVCLHFDGTKSPNVIAKKTIFPFLYTYEDWLRVKDDPDAQRTVSFWSQDRGFWPPEGFVNTLLTVELIERCGARGKVAFDGATTPIGGLDSGFGGDKCILRFGRLGHTRSGAQAVQLDERIEIPILVDARDSDGKPVPAEYQIAERVEREARLRGVAPMNFGIEATGTGRGAAAVLTQEWGEVIWVESGGRPSELMASEEDERPAREVYDRRITELWFSVQAFVKGKQLGGLLEDDVQQFCARTYVFQSKKYSIEKKEDLKLRIGRSPDDADSVAVVIEVARQRGMHTRGPRTDRIAKRFAGELEAQTALYNPDTFYQPEAPEGLVISGPTWDPR